MKCWTKFAALLLCVSAVLASASERGKGVQETQARGFWTDPSTGLMWAGKDNGKDVTWHKAMRYCRDLRLDGYSDWRLANMAELQGVFDLTANAPGQAGPRKEPRDFTFHVKGDLFLTGNQWSSNYRMDDRGRPIGYAYYFDFNSGKPDDDQGGYSYGKRALCVRGQRLSTIPTSSPSLGPKSSASPDKSGNRTSGFQSGEQKASSPQKNVRSVPEFRPVA